MDKSIPIFVALAPAIAFAVAGFVIEIGPSLRSWGGCFMQSVPRVEWLKDFVMGAAVFGSTIAGVLGLRSDSAGTMVVSVAWFTVMQFVSYLLSKKLEFLQERDVEVERARHRKIAGTVRSIVRDELLKAMVPTGKTPGV